MLINKINDLFKIFKDKDLLNLALTHRSWLNEHPGKRTSNERLEFLGDAVLEFIVSDEIYKLFPNSEEGYLTTLRSKIVNTTNLAKVSTSLSLGEKIFLSKGEDEGGGRNNLSLLADSLEALIGAMFLDQGIEITREFIKSHILADISSKIQQPLKDAKSRLQEYIQAKGLSLPRYKVFKETGPDHSKEFLIQLKINNKVYSTGRGKTKSQAEQSAAKKALNIFISKNRQVSS